MFEIYAKNLKNFFENRSFPVTASNIHTFFIVPNIIDLLEFVQSKNRYLSIGGNHEQNNQTDRLCER